MGQLGDVSAYEKASCQAEDTTAKCARNTTQTQSHTLNDRRNVFTSQTGHIYHTAVVCGESQQRVHCQRCSGNIRAAYVLRKGRGDIGELSR